MKITFSGCRLAACVLILSIGPGILAQKPELVVEPGHTHLIHCVAFNPDGSLLASGAEDHTVKIWDVNMGRVLRTLNGHRQGVRAVAFSPSGRLLASGSEDGAIRIWNVISGASVGSLPRHSSEVSSLAFAANRKLLVSGSWDHTIKLWDMTNGKLIRTIDVQSAVYSLALSKDEKLIASGSLDGVIKLWDIESGDLVRSLPGHKDRVTSVTFSPDGKLLASSSLDKSIKLWDPSTGNTISTLDAWSDTVAFTPDGQTLVSGNIIPSKNLSEIKTWDVKTGLQAGVAEVGDGFALATLALSPDGKNLITAVAQTLALWELTGLRKLGTFTGSHGLISSVAISPDGGKLVSASHDMPIKVWDLTSGGDLLSFSLPEGAPVTFDPTGTLLATGSYQKIKLCDLAENRETHTLNDQPLWIMSLAFSPDGKVLASGGTDSVRLWEVASGKPLQVLSPGPFAFNKGGNLLASSTGKEIKFWELPGGKESGHHLAGDTSGIIQIVFVNDATLAGVSKQAVKFWNIQADSAPRLVLNRNDEIEAVAFTPDAKLVAVRSGDGRIGVWDVAGGNEIYTLPAPYSATSAMFSPNGKILVTGGGIQR